ncbi:MAG: glycosyltransferase [Deltaproteobacteria bacterium]
MGPAWGANCPRALRWPPIHSQGVSPSQPGRVDSRCATPHQRRRRLRCLPEQSLWDGGIAGERICTALGIAHVHTPHSLGIWKHRQMLPDYPGDSAALERKYDFRARNLQERRIASMANLLIATTPDQKDCLEKDYDLPLKKLALIPPGYDDTRFYPVGSDTRALLRRKFGFEGKVILSLGRIARNKGYDLLVRAFAEVASRDPAARLHLAIGGERLQAAEEAILGGWRELVNELGLSSRVSFSGFVPDADIADLYRAADVFVLSSRYEPFGMAAVEAMACGTPAVVTIHGGLFRVLRFGIDGLFADTFDPMDLAITILKPLQYPRIAARLGRCGAETARRLFTWGGARRACFGRPSGSGTRILARSRIRECVGLI